MSHIFPQSLSTVRVLLFVRYALATLAYVFALIVLDGMSRSETDDAYGMTKGLSAFWLVVGLTMAIFDFYVAATLKRGGNRARILVRAAVGAGFAGVLLNVLLGWWIGAAVALALAVAILVLAEREPSREWFETTQRGAKYSGG
jgi:hypothetical protein